MPGCAPASAALAEVGSKTDAFRCFKRKISDKDARSPQDDLLWSRQKAIAPIDGGVQGLLAGKGYAITPRLELEALVQPVCKRDHPHLPYLPCSQFERQGETIQLTADLRYDSSIALREPRVLDLVLLCLGWPQPHQPEARFVVIEIGWITNYRLDVMEQLHAHQPLRR